MADEDLKTDIVDGEGEDGAKKLFGLPKKMVIIVGAVLLLIIIGVTAFLLLGEEPEPEVEETTTEETVEDPESADGAESTEPEAGEESPEVSVYITIDSLEQQLTTIQEQNLLIAESLKRMESYLASQSNSSQRQSYQQFLNQYGAENDAAFPPIVTEPPAPKPEPSWGDFKRAN